MKTLEQLSGYPQYDTTKSGEFVEIKWMGYGKWHRWIKNAQGKNLYYDNYRGIWKKWAYDNNGNEIYYENSKGSKGWFDENNSMIKGVSYDPKVNGTMCPSDSKLMSQKPKKKKWWQL